jgi:ABC-type lipoprotein export system ATPase subunit
VTVTEPTELAGCREVSVIHRSGTSAVHALAAIEFTIRAGERVALFGPSGSGKTTLLHVLGGLVAPDDGTVSRPRDEAVALVFQSGNLLPTFSAYENVAFAARAAGRRDPSAALRADVVELLTLVGLAAKLDALPSELSGGEVQRVAIARALIRRPALLLCDEPTGQLDSATGTRVLELIDALHAELAFAQVTATHDPDVAGRHDRAVVLADGHVMGEESF